MTETEKIYHALLEELTEAGYVDGGATYYPDVDNFQMYPMLDDSPLRVFCNGKEGWIQIGDYTKRELACPLTDIVTGVNKCFQDLGLGEPLLPEQDSTP